MRIVLYQPQQSRHAGDRSMDLLPLELLHVAGYPVRDGHECVLVDGNLHSQEEAHRRVLEACEGAQLFATTGILGWQVADAQACAERVRARHPRIPRVVGGWFTSVLPELHLRDGTFDVSVLGQGELSFRELVEAYASGSALEDVAGLALWRDGGVHRTELREVVGFDRLVDPAWELVDFEPYRAAQLRGGEWRDGLRLPGPPPRARREPYVGISYFASFGCPEPCTFCCSPFVTQRRWKAQPAEKILDDVEMLHERWGGFDVVRFHDANFGVREERVRAFAEGLLDRGLRVGWNAFLETHSVLRYDAATLDRCAESGCYLVQVGAETGDESTMRSIGKPIHGDDNLDAAVRLHERGIGASVTYIVGMPGEPEASMLATIDEARRIQVRCPRATVHLMPYRPIPGTELYGRAVEQGYRPPDSVREWGEVGRYHLDPTWDGVPERVERQRRLLEHYATLFKGIARERRGVFEAVARWRMRRGDWRFPIDAKLFTWVLRSDRRSSTIRPQRRAPRNGAVPC